MLPQSQDDSLKRHGVRRAMTCSVSEMIRSVWMKWLLAVLTATIEFGVCHADELQDGLRACAKLGEDLERLSCYDRLARFGIDARKAPLSASPIDMFGSRPPTPVTTPAPEIARGEIKSITAHVTVLQERKHAGVTLNLDNGQQWQELGTEDLLLKVGDTVKISRGTFNSFILMTEGNRLANVKRIE